MVGVFPLQTERLILRLMTENDIDALHAYHQLEEVARYQFWTERSREELEAELAKWMAMDGSVAADGKLCVACIRKSDDTLIGDLFLGISNREARQAEVGYSFNPEYHGKGYASEAVSALLDYGFNTAGLHRIVGRCDARNNESFKLLERLGLRREAHFREHALFKGAWDEEYYYAILEDEWRSKRKASA